MIIGNEMTCLLDSLYNKYTRDTYEKINHSNDSTKLNTYVLDILFDVFDE